MALVVRGPPASVRDVRDADAIPGWGRPAGGGPGNPLAFLPGEPHAQGSPEGCSPWGHKESDMTEATEHSTHTH